MPPVGQSQAALGFMDETLFISQATAEIEAAFANCTTEESATFQLENVWHPEGEVGCTTVNKRLSIEVAKTLMAQYRVEQSCPNDWGVLDLSLYSQIDPPALQYLASQKINGIVILGLNRVDAFTARTIAGAWRAHHVFSECLYLLPEVAAILADRIDGLFLEWMPELGVEAARALAKTRGQLGVGRLEELSLAMAEAFAGHTHELFVSVATRPPMFVQRALLFSHAGYVVHLSFPADDIPSTDWYVGNVKKVTVGSYTDDAGQLWAHIVASEDIDSWRLRQ